MYLFLSPPDTRKFISKVNPYRIVEGIDLKFIGLLFDCLATGLFLGLLALWFGLALLVGLAWLGLAWLDFL